MGGNRAFKSFLLIHSIKSLNSFIEIYWQVSHLSVVQQSPLSSPCILCLCRRGERERGSAYMLGWATVELHIATVDNSFLGQEVKHDSVSGSKIQCSRTELPEVETGWDWRAETEEVPSRLQQEESGTSISTTSGTAAR